jgi:hypothetical protein
MRSDQSGSAIGHRFAAVYIFLGPFAVAAVFCFAAVSCSTRSFQSSFCSSHDGMRAYALSETLHNWSQFAGATVTPIEGMTRFG